jgi:hypothetical protein
MNEGGAASISNLLPRLDELIERGNSLAIFSANPHDARIVMDQLMDYQKRFRKLQDSPSQGKTK